LGATDDEIGRFLGVTAGTIVNWRLRHAAFAEACRVGKGSADDRVFAAFYKSALGYDREVEVVQFTPRGDALKATKVEHVPGDVKAQSLWLANRRRDEFSLVPTARVKIDLGRLNGPRGLAEAGEKTLRALAAGELSGQEAAGVAQIIALTAKAWEVSELESRLAHLEQQQAPLQLPPPGGD
jgi:hypothetical protein